MDLTEQIAAYLAHERLRRRERGVVSYGKTLQHLARFAAGQPLDARLIESYFATRIHLAPATIAADMAAIASFGRWGLRRGLITGDLLAYVERPRITRGDVIEAPRATIAQISAWLQTPDGLARSRRFVGMCLYGGLRITEARLADWAYVDLIGRELVVRADTAKGGKARRIPIAPPLGRLLALVPLGERHGAVAGQPDGRPLSRGGAEHIFDRELPRFGIEVTAHQLRRAFATRLDEQGVSLRVIQELLGHSSLATTERYIGVDRARKIAAVDGLDF